MVAALAALATVAALNVASYLIPASRFAELLAKLEKLAKKAAKLGVAPVEIELGDMVARPFTRENVVNSFGEVKGYFYNPISEEAAKSAASKVFWFQFHEVTVKGNAPAVAGWTFVATLNHFHDEKGASVNVLKVVPGWDNKVPESYRHADASNCDHCKKSIKTRKDTFVLFNAETGEWKQVGRNCLCDFLGGIDPHAVAARLESILSVLSYCKDSEDYGFGGGFTGNGEAMGVPMATFLAFVAAIIRVDGWMPRGKAKEEGVLATADKVFLALNPTDAEAKWAASVQPTDVDSALAASALEYVRETLSERDPDTLNDYEHNLKVTCSLSSVSRKTAGFVASAVNYYTRALAAAEEAKLAKVSNHFGEIGKRETFKLTLVSTFARETFYGISWITKLVDSNGNRATWFASDEPDMKVGETRSVTATVKSHGEYKGVKETTITRCKVLSPEEAAKLEAKAAKAAAKAAKLAAKPVA